MQPHESVKVGDLRVTAISIMHGKLPILGFRINDIAYITDMKTMPDSELELLQGLRLLIVNGLRQKPHPTHQTIDEAVNLVRRLEVPEARIIHMSHDVGLHADIDPTLPEGIHLAYDGEVIEIND